MDLITTVAYHTSNSYGTLAEATSYFSDYSRLPSSTTWNGLTDNQKKMALVIAARILDTFSFRGLKCNKQQALSFPRFTLDQLNGDFTQVNSFYDITYTKMIDEEELNVSNNKFISTSSSADDFYDYIDDGDISFNQLIKVVRGSTEYLTIYDMDVDGEWIQVREDIEEETDLTTTIYYSDIFGFPDEIKYAQFELAFQVVDTKLFQGTIGEATEFPVASFNISDALTVRYKHALSTANPFENSVPLDIVHYWLGPWIAGVKGYVV